MRRCWHQATEVKPSLDVVFSNGNKNSCRPFLKNNIAKFLVSFLKDTLQTKGILILVKNKFKNKVIDINSLKLKYKKVRDKFDPKPQRG